MLKAPSGLCFREAKPLLSCVIQRVPRIPSSVASHGSECGVYIGIGRNGIFRACACVFSSVEGWNPRVDAQSLVAGLRDDQKAASCCH